MSAHEPASNVHTLASAFTTRHSPCRTRDAWGSGIVRGDVVGSDAPPAGGGALEVVRAACVVAPFLTLGCGVRAAPVDGLWLPPKRSTATAPVSMISSATPPSMRRRPPPPTAAAADAKSLISTPATAAESRASGTWALTSCALFGSARSSSARALGGGARFSASQPCSRRRAV